MFRRRAGMPQLVSRFSSEQFWSAAQQHLEIVVLRQDGVELAIPVDERMAALKPFRSDGGLLGGSFRHISAGDVLAHRLPAQSLRGKNALLETITPSLLDLRAMPVCATFPGVGTHANLIAGLTDSLVLVKPD